jgi:hypothetical protein
MHVKVEKVDRERAVIVYRKVRDLKGRWPTDVIRHALGKGPDRDEALDWAVPGKTTTMFALESYKWSHVYLNQRWYASTTTDWQFWNTSHTEPILLRTFSGRPEKLVAAVTAIMANQEVAVPCLVGDNPDDLLHRRAKVQRIRAGLKLQDYNPKRDFVAWGGDDFTPIASMPGFSHIAMLGNVGADAQALSCVDIDGDGNPDLCLAGGNKLALFQNGGDAFLELRAPVKLSGCRAALWADYNGDGRPDLFLATPEGPRLFTKPRRRPVQGRHWPST